MRVIPAKAGITFRQGKWDASLRWHDDIEESEVD